LPFSANDSSSRMMLPPETVRTRFFSLRWVRSALFLVTLSEIFRRRDSIAPDDDIGGAGGKCHCGYSARMPIPRLLHVGLLARSRPAEEWGLFAGGPWRVPGYRLAARSHEAAIWDRVSSPGEGAAGGPPGCVLTELPATLALCVDACARFGFLLAAFGRLPLNTSGVGSWPGFWRSHTPANTAISVRTVSRCSGADASNSCHAR
jgi:hypothetical protein